MSASLERITIEGRTGSALYIDDDWKPVEPARATLVRVSFDDGGSMFLVPNNTDEEKRWDESDHPRAGDGKWTSGGGGGVAVMDEDPEPPKAKPSRVKGKNVNAAKVEAAAHPQTKTPAFKKWFGDSKVVDENDDPLVVYHGTTWDFESFDKSHATADSAWGAGHYFTNEPADASANYAGIGPDLTGRIESKAEQIVASGEGGDADTLSAMGEEAARESWSEKMVAARELAKKELVGSAGAAVVPAFLSMQKPFTIGGDDETHLSYYIRYDPEDDEYAEPTGDLVTFLDALREKASEHASDYEREKIDGLISHLSEKGMEGDGLSASELLKATWQSGPMDHVKYLDEEHEHDILNYLTDDNGNLVGKEVLRAALESAGFDGVVDRMVNKKYGSDKGYGKPMEGMNEGTVHYVVFKPTQIKSAIGNSGKFSKTDARITRAIAEWIEQRWDESQHPREGDGKFTSGGGGSATATADEKPRTEAPPSAKPKTGVTGRPWRSTGAVSAENDDDAGFVRDLKTAESKIFNRFTEFAHIWRGDNSFAAEVTSDAKDEVRFSDDDMKQMRDGVLTHNHPRGYPLSVADVSLAAQVGLREIRAVGYDGSLYAMRRTGETWPSRLRDTIREVEDSQLQSGRHALTTVRSEPERDAMIAKLEREHYSKVWERVAKEFAGKIVYEERRGVYAH